MTESFFGSLNSFASPFASTAAGKLSTQMNVLFAQPFVPSQRVISTYVTLSRSISLPVDETTSPRLSEPIQSSFDASSSFCFFMARSCISTVLFPITDLLARLSEREPASLFTDAPSFGSSFTMYAFLFTETAYHGTNEPPATTGAATTEGALSNAMPCETALSSGSVLPSNGTATAFAGRFETPRTRTDSDSSANSAKSPHCEGVSTARTIYCAHSMSLLLPETYSLFIKPSYRSE